MKWKNEKKTIRKLNNNENRNKEEKKREKKIVSSYCKWSRARSRFFSETGAVRGTVKALNKRRCINITFKIVLQILTPVLEFFLFRCSCAIQKQMDFNWSRKRRTIRSIILQLVRFYDAVFQSNCVHVLISCSIFFIDSSN